jgi:Pentapeptide repeats (8 copies)
VFAAGALFYTARNFALSRQQAHDTAEAEGRTLQLTEQGQVTDRYTKAIEQLGSDKLDVRLGGIYALERIARDSARDHPTVMEVLSAFIREHSREQWPPREPDADMPGPATRPDVQAAVTVVGRRTSRDHPDADRIDVQGANLTGANLTRADLTGAILTRARFAKANLSSAMLARADLTDAYLTEANLTAAFLAELSRTQCAPKITAR